VQRVQLARYKFISGTATLPTVDDSSKPITELNHRICSAPSISVCNWNNDYFSEPDRSTVSIIF